MYNNSDNVLLKQNIEKITEDADNIRLSKVEPTKDKMWEIIYIFEFTEQHYGKFNWDIRR